MRIFKSNNNVTLNQTEPAKAPQDHGNQNLISKMYRFIKKLFHLDRNTTKTPKLLVSLQVKFRHRPNLQSPAAFFKRILDRLFSRLRPMKKMGKTLEKASVTT